MSLRSRGHIPLPFTLTTTSIHSDLNPRFDSSNPHHISWHFFRLTSAGRGEARITLLQRRGLLSLRRRTTTFETYAMDRWMEQTSKSKLSSFGEVEFSKADDSVSMVRLHQYLLDLSRADTDECAGQYSVFALETSVNLKLSKISFQETVWILKNLQPHQTPA